MDTGDKLVENMFICPERKILIATVSDKVKVFEVRVKDADVELKEI